MARSHTDNRVPIGLAAAALLLWGVGTHQLVIAALLAAVVEGRRVVRSRWAMDDSLLSRVWTLCMVLFLLSLVIGMMRAGLARAGFSAIAWLPVTVAPMLLAQLYSGRDGIPTRLLSAVSRRLHRKRSSEVPAAADRTVNLEYPYIAVVLIAAGTSRPESYVFYAGATMLVAIALFMNRARPRMNPLVWLLVMALVVAVGHAAHIGLHNLHVRLENLAVGLAAGDTDMDGNRAMTRIGAVGEMKQSHSIDWWLKVRQGTVPAYLRIASFDTYRRQAWFATEGRELQPVQRQGAGEWIIAPGTDTRADSGITLTGRSQRDETPLALPARPLELIRLEAEAVSRRRTGLTLASRTPHILDFDVRYEADANADLEPTDRDLLVPEELAKDLKRILGERNLASARPRDVLAGLSAFFTEHFKYSLFLEIDGRIDGRARDPILQFLEENRKGHCEYFATATALLLRSAGVPARYVTGYVVSEHDGRRDRYVIRGLHAHAWVEAWLDGRWEYVDTTPGGWMSEENKALSGWQPVRDWLEGLPVEFSVWLAGPHGRLAVTWFRRGSLPLLALYLWFRLFKGQRSRRIRPARHAGGVVPGANSPWYELEPRLTERFGSRGAGEPLCCWWRRVQTGCEEPLRTSVSEAIALHYALRFDPDAPGDGGMDRLAQRVRTCLDAMPLRSVSRAGLCK